MAREMSNNPFPHLICPRCGRICEVRDVTRDDCQYCRGRELCPHEGPRVREGDEPPKGAA